MQGQCRQFIFAEFFAGMGGLSEAMKFLAGVERPSGGGLQGRNRPMCHRNRSRTLRAAVPNADTSETVG